MASLTKTIQTPFFTVQSLASNSVAISSGIDVSQKLSASVFLRFGRTVTTALTTALTYRIEGSASLSTVGAGDGYWFPLAQFLTNIAAVADEAVNGTCNAAQKVIGMASTTGFTVGMRVFIKNSTFANSEFGIIAAVTSNTSITLEDNLVNAQTGSTVYADAQSFTAANLDLSGVKVIRCVAAGPGTGQAVAIEAHVITCDSIG